MEKMDADQYLTARLGGQIDWYSRKSKWNQTWFKRLQMTQITASALIPCLSGFGEKIPYSPMLIGALGMLTAIATAAQSLYKFQDYWMQYRITAEQLERERVLFLTGVEPYQGDKAFELLVLRVEGLMAKENAAWTQTTQNTEKQKTAPEEAVNPAP